MVRKTWCSDESLSRKGLPFHLDIGWRSMDRREAQAQIKTERGIVSIGDFEPYRYAAGSGVGHKRVHDCGSNSAPAQMRHDSVINHVDHVARTVDHNAADGSVRQLDYV